MKKQAFGGGRSISNERPILEVSGFALDTKNQRFVPGDIIPAGTLLSADEQTRLARVVKSAKVVAIDVANAKIVTLESDEYLKPIFAVGDSVLKTVSGTFAAAPTIIAINRVKGVYILTLSAAIAGLAVGDPIFEVVSVDDNAALVGPCTYLVPVDTKVDPDGFPTSIGATDRWKVYMRRIPVMPSTLIQDPGKGFPAYLKANPEIKFSKTF